MLYFYLIQSVLCFLICLVASKTLDGKVTRGDVLFASVFSIIPGFNAFVFLWAIYELLNNRGSSVFWTKKVF